VEYITLNVLRAEHRPRVAERLSGAESEGALVWGQVEDLDSIRDLLSPVVLLRSLRSDESPPPAFGARLARLATAGVRVPSARPVLIVPEPPPAAIRTVLVVSLLGPLFGHWQDTMAGVDAYPITHIGDDTYTVTAPNEDDVAGLPFVSAVRRYERDDTIRLLAAPEELLCADPVAALDVSSHGYASTSLIEEWLTGHGAQILARSQGRLRCLVRRDAGLLLALADNQDVALVEEVQPTEPANDHASKIVGIAACRTTHRGTGQIVAVADTGIDKQHPDIAPRLRKAVDLAGRGTTADPSGHGTHVAASIAGAGLSDPAFTGMAPDCEIHFQAITGLNGRLMGETLLPVILSDAESAGASIVNLSWTELNGYGRYSGTAQTIDEFVRDHPTILVVAAAGNQGTEATPSYGQAGHAAKRTVAPPSTAKNCLGIGASRSDIAGVSTTIMPQDWRTWFPAEFKNAPIASDLLSGDATCLDARSGRGPSATDYRIKPDLVAPGTFICSARANVGITSTFWALHSNQNYAYTGGTSMATAIVSGCAAVVRDWVVNDRGHQPSAALLRALLVNGSATMPGWDAVQDGREVPNVHEGFGRVDLAGILPDPSRPGFGSWWVDDWQGNDGLDLTGIGQTVAVRFYVNDGSAPLRLCLTWDDPPGPAVVNPLELVVTLETPDDPATPLMTWRSNTHAPGRQRSEDEADLWNNVHIVRVQDPETGWYTARVQANNKPYGLYQRFALAFSGWITDRETPWHEA
jgi:serine protease AprX